MTTLKQSGYLAAETAIVWTSGQGINSLTDNEYTDLADEIENSTDRHLRVDLRFVIASAAFTGVDSGMEVFLVRSVNGTDYPTWTGNGTTDRQENRPFLRDFVPFTGTTGAQAPVAEAIDLPPGKYRWAFRNRGNVSLAASGNFIYWRPHSYDQA